jgi:L-threonylcarbamoyladenylate synthase
MSDAIASPMSNANYISKAAQIILQGGLVAFPTETVYGLGADATQDHAVARIYAAKGRPQFNPLISHVVDVEAAFALGEFSADALKLAARFWPGPLTLVVPRRVDCSVSLLASAGLPSLALRVPAHPLALEFLRAVGKPVVAPSANPSGRISPTTAQHVRDHLQVDLVLDGGPCAVGVESTVVSFLNGSAELLRAGGLSRNLIEDAVLQKLRVSNSSVLHSPGQLESHYAPQAHLILNATDNVMLGFGAIDGDLNLSKSGNVDEAAANLFRMLHELDAKGPQRIAVAPIPYHGLGEAINDRLKRAAAPR